MADASIVGTNLAGDLAGAFSLQTSDPPARPATAKTPIPTSISPMQAAGAWPQRALWVQQGMTATPMAASRIVRDRTIIRRQRLPCRVNDVGRAKFRHYFAPVHPQSAA